MPNSPSIVSKVWNYAHVLKNAGVGYCDYVGQITYPLIHRFVGQRQIVAKVEASTTVIDHLEAELNRQITYFNRLRRSIFATAFSGTL